jgi:hypothetical protein
MLRTCQHSHRVSDSDDTIVPEHLRARLRWGDEHDEAAHEILRAFGLQLPRDRELIRQLSYAWVAFGPLEFDE